MVNDVKRILVHSQNIDEAAFVGKYGRLLQITKIEVLNAAINSLISFWDPDYSFWKCELVSNYRRVWNVDGISQKSTQGLLLVEKRQSDSRVGKITENSTFGKIFREECQWVEMEITQGGATNKKSRVWIGGRMRQVDRSGIYGLVLFLSLTGVISLEVVAVFVEYENTLVNPVVAILVDTFLTLNHFRKTRKGAMRCCTQLLYI